VDYALLYSRLDEADSAKVIASLDDAKVPYKIKQGGSIFVAADKVDVMRIQLASKVRRGDVVGYEIFDKPNFGLSDFAQRVNFLRATKGDLERTIGHLDDGLAIRRVGPYTFRNRLLIDNKNSRRRGFGPAKGQRPIAVGVGTPFAFVSSAVEGLQPNQPPLRTIKAMSSLNRPTTIRSLAVQHPTGARRNLEQYFAKKAESMLEKVVGAGQAVVRVAADTDYETQTTTKEEFDADKTAIRKKNFKKDVSTSTTSSAGGVPGITTNTGGETNSLATNPPTTTRTETEDKQEEFDNSKTTSSLLKAAGSLKRLSAAVFVAARHEGTGATRKVVPRTPEELEKLRRIVQSALGIQPSADRKDEITLEEMLFNEQFTTESTQAFEKQEQRQFWWNLLRQLVYPALALGILIVFWRAFMTPAENIPLGIPLGLAAGNGNGNGNGNGGFLRKSQLAESADHGGCHG
jgi:flagellar M-ring protein FliF